MTSASIMPRDADLSVRPTDDVPDVTLRCAGKLSYAASIENPAARLLGRAVERLFGRERLERRYDAYRRDRVAGRIGSNARTFWDEAVRRMGVRIDAAHTDRVPTEGSLVIVANHPFGVMDGIAIAQTIGKVRDDLLILAHEALARVPETRSYLLTVDFSETQAAERHNVRIRAEALKHLRRGGALLVFPAGNVMTTPHALAHCAVDAPWGPLTARLIMKSSASVLPVHVAGQNGRLFQIVSQFSQTLRYALLFRETARHIHGRIELRLGHAIGPDAIARWGDADTMTARLRAHVEALAEPTHLADVSSALWLDPLPPVPAGAPIPRFA